MVPAENDGDKVPLLRVRAESVASVLSVSALLPPPPQAASENKLINTNRWIATLWKRFGNETDMNTCLVYVRIIDGGQSIKPLR